MKILFTNRHTNYQNLRTNLFIIFVLCLFSLACSDGGNKKRSPLSPNSLITIDFHNLEDIYSYNAASYSIRGRCSANGHPIFANVGGFEVETICANGSWSTIIDVTGLNKRPGMVIVLAYHKINNKTTVPVSHTVENHFTCPRDFVGVPANQEYSKKSFCVAKYEMKKKSRKATSHPKSQPWRIQRQGAISQCKKIGHRYSLLTNDRWQNIVRNAETFHKNWMDHSVGSVGGMSQGHTDNHPPHGLEAGPDNNGCFGKTASCTNETWHSQKRTLTLSNKEIIWDLGGNVAEWVQDDNLNNQNRWSTLYGTDDYISQITNITHSYRKKVSESQKNRSAKEQFGTQGHYNHLDQSPYGGFGYALLGADEGPIRRGGPLSKRGSRRSLCRFPCGIKK